MKRFFLIIVAIHAATCLWAYDFEVDGLCYNIISISDSTAYTAEVTHHPTSPYEASSITIPELENASGLINTTLWGILIDLSDWQFLKAYDSMLVIELGMVTEVSA